MPETCPRHNRPILTTKFKPGGIRVDMCDACLFDPVKPRPSTKDQDDKLLRKLGFIK